MSTVSTNPEQSTNESYLICSWQVTYN